MKVCTCLQTVLFVIGILLVILHVAMSIRNAIRNLTAASCSEFFKHILQKAWSFFKYLKEQASPAEADKHIQERLKFGRLAAAKASHSGGANVMCLVVGFSLWNMAWDSPRWMTAGQDVATILIFALQEFARLGPRPTELLMDIYYGLLMLLFAGFLWFSSPGAVFFSFFWSLAARFAVSILYSKMNSVFFWNMVVTCLSFMFYQQSAQDSAPASMMMIFEAGVIAALFYSVSAMQTWSVALIKQELKVGNLKMENSAALLLLDMSCDVVLRLNIDLTLENDSQQFAALLMRSSGVPMQGVKFPDFITSEDDRIAFEEKVSALGASSDEFVGSCRATLSDSLHNPVNVEMTFVKVSTRDDEDSLYLLGIREFGDVAPVMPAFSRQRPKSHKALAHKGTPSSFEHGDFESKKAPSLPGARAQTTKLRFPSLVPTVPEAMIKETIAAMTRWNIEVPRTTCCSFHAYVAKMKETLQKSSSFNCICSFPEGQIKSRLQKLQCQSCGLLDPVELDDGYHECSFCESRDVRPLIPVVSL